MSRMLHFLDNAGRKRNDRDMGDSGGTVSGQLRRSNLSFAGRTGHTPIGVSRLSRSGENQFFDCPFGAEI
jgi:hypothetical protein